MCLFCHQMLQVGLLLLMSGLVSGSITCPDGTMCSDHSTCCKTLNGYECCPVPEAVCCSDQYHCCPKSYTCNFQTKMCDKTGFKESIPMVKKIPAEDQSKPVEVNQFISVSSAGSSLVFCDNYFFCNDGTSCCRHHTGLWYCCPFPLAFCCSDGNHCCPYGFHCDVTSTQCLKSGLRIPWATKETALKHTATLIDSASPTRTVPSENLGSVTIKSSVIRCDRTRYCPDKTTCCKKSDGTWACCPYPLATCCQDGYHCCPFNYSCDRTSTKCNKKGLMIPSAEKESAMTDTDNE
ncbi:progranulin-like [Acipenser oxyrinchus oxyrinchus]|uniref:Progranulin-like n=1 Tax=Acipenser oxyrinchus oxyrinchus TaxID=40147 RepID=A0AAD8GEN5_ACIOX|nr:progranulin-like [Acipenser oxyrinchus oxyrinchus]